MSDVTKIVEVDGKFQPPAEFTERAWVKSMEQYKEMYDRSLNDPEGFWAEYAEEFTWFKKWDKVWDYNYDRRNGKVFLEWFKGAQTNITVNALDRHLDERGDQTAIIWVGNDLGDDKYFTYRELYEQVNKAANMLKAHGVKKGDRVSLYMQMIPELAIAMMACARIGAIHSIVFGAFSPDSLSDRITDSTCTIVITQDTGLRGSKNNVPMKTNADTALTECPSIEKVVVVKRTGNEVPMTDGRDLWWEAEMDKVDADCPPRHKWEALRESASGRRVG